MELAIIPKNKQPKPQVAVVQVKTQPKKQKNKNKKKKSKKNGSSSGLSSLYADKSNTAQLRLALTCPDISGPVRIPRMGASQRTGLGYDRTNQYLGATAAYSLMVPTTAFNGGGVVCTVYTAADANTVWGTPTTLSVGAQWPNAASINDVNLVALCMVANYVGSPLNVAGEVIMGTIPQAALTSSNFSGLSYYPGVVRMPLSNLISDPLRVFGVKTSPSSNTFVPVGTVCDDYEIPFIAITSVVTAQALNIAITRSFEYRSTVQSGGMIPYERTAESFSKDISMYEDAVGAISEVPARILDANSEYFREMALGYLGNQLLPSAVATGTSLLHALGNRHLGNVRAGGGARGMLPF